MEAPPGTVRFWASGALRPDARTRRSGPESSGWRPRSLMETSGWLRLSAVMGRELGAASWTGARG
eukprot:8089104-Prorocentrum_lima.AAC.1